MPILRRLIPILLLCATGAAAQSSSDEIVVTAEPKKMMRDFVRAMGDSGRNGQLARWQNVVCPGIIGLDEGQAKLVAGRIGAVARTLHLHPEGSGCRPTILILFTGEADSLAGEFARRLPVTLRGEGRSRLNRFVRTDAPVRWIAKTDLVGGALPNSRLTRATRADLSIMLIVVDSKRLAGFRLAELGDYLAFVALSNPGFGPSPDRASILAMFTRPRDSGETFAMTEFDLAYLKGLYDAPAKAGEADQQRSILTTMGRRVGRKKDR